MRPAVLQILRAAGFHNTSGAALDVMTDLAIRYLSLLASSTAENAFNNHDDYVPTIQDVRMALLEVGALRPQMSALEERAKGAVKINRRMVPFEDMRGVEAFLNWARGPASREIRRVAGLVPGPGDLIEVGVLDEHKDYVTAMKNKHNKSDDDSRYQGTLLGKQADQQIITILGGPVTSIHEWDNQLRSRNQWPLISGPASSIISSAPATPMNDTFGDD